MPKNLQWIQIGPAGGLRKTQGLDAVLRHGGRPTRHFCDVEVGGASVEGAPVAGVAGHEAAGDEQDEVHEPPDAQSAQRQQLPHRRARVTQAEAVDAEAAQEEGVEQRGDEVVACVPARDESRVAAQRWSPGKTLTSSGEARSLAQWWGVH